MELGERMLEDKEVLKVIKRQQREETRRAVRLCPGPLDAPGGRGGSFVDIWGGAGDEGDLGDPGGGKEEKENAHRREKPPPQAPTHAPPQAP